MVSTDMFHTMKAPMFVLLPLTKMKSVISTLFAQHALLRSSSLASLSRSLIASAGRKDSVDMLEMFR